GTMQRMHPIARMLRVVALIVAVALLPALPLAAKALTIYFIDVEGGQSTLIVTPAGESLLVDTGYARGGGTLDTRPGDPAQARDANRIVAAARDAGVSRIDNLLITHFHADHDGGVTELSKLLPIRRFIDHGGVLPQAEETSRGTTEMWKLYD